MLLWLQDLGVAVAEAVAFTWLCEIASRRLAPLTASTSMLNARRDALWLAGAGLALLVVNPWIWWGISFDYHFETIGHRVHRAAGLGYGQRPPPGLVLGDAPRWPAAT